MRPVVAKMCQMESLRNGALDLCDIAMMNDALDAEAENVERYRQWAKAQNPRPRR